MKKHIYVSILFVLSVVYYHNSFSMNVFEFLNSSIIKKAKELKKKRFVENCLKIYCVGRILSAHPMLPKEVAEHIIGFANVAFFDKIDLNKILKTKESCSICLEEFGCDTEFLPCAHEFHTKCINEWLKIKSTCPVCRHNTNRQNNDDLEDLEDILGLGEFIPLVGNGGHWEFGD